MQAREYRPDFGVFLSADRFEAAGLDLAHQSDPLTQNRYAFAGGNPVSRIEWDGHIGWEMAAAYDNQRGGARAKRRAQRRYNRRHYGEDSRYEKALGRQRRDLGEEIVDSEGFQVFGDEGNRKRFRRDIKRDKLDLGTLQGLQEGTQHLEAENPDGFLGFARGVFLGNRATFEAVKEDPVGAAKSAIEGIPDLIEDPGSLFECHEGTNQSQCNGEAFTNLVGTKGVGTALRGTKLGAKSESDSDSGSSADAGPSSAGELDVDRDGNIIPAPGERRQEYLGDPRDDLRKQDSLLERQRNLQKPSARRSLLDLFGDLFDSD